MRSIKRDESRFAGRLLLTALVIAAGIALWRLIDVFLLAFGSVLLALALSGLSRKLRRVTGLGAGLALAAVVLALIAAVAAIFWLFGAQIAAQYDEIVTRAPAALDRMSEFLLSQPAGRYMVERLKGMEISSATGVITATVAHAMSSLAQIIAYSIFVIFGAVYLAADPKRYRAGLLRLIPPSYRRRGGEFLDMSGDVLQRWLLGQLAVMAMIGTMSGIGLWLLGVDAALALGLTGGLLCFVPFVGAILAAVPATLMAFAQSPTEAGYTILLFAGVHFIEGNFLTPLIQDEAVSLPPVISVFSTLIFTILFGAFAVMVAVPITLVGLTALEMLYVEDVLGDAPPGPPAKAAKAPIRRTG